MKILHKITGAILFETEKDNLREADLREADLQNADLQNANLQNANLRYSYLQNANLREANLQNANLQNAYLQNAYLQNANLQNADLREANLQNANLQNAYLQNADLQNANLQNANLRYSDLQNANLQNANLRYADFRYADLQNANLQNANLHGHSNVTEGTMTVYKKASGKVIQLIIPSQSGRISSLVGRKCRCEYAYVKAILNTDRTPSGLQQVIGNYDKATVYQVGKKVTPDKYCDDTRIECSHGIHFFLTFEEAASYE